MVGDTKDQKLKADAGKTRFDLIPPRVELALARVLTYGLKTYEEESWRRVSPTRYVAAFGRHFNAHKRGEFYDKDSGLPHLWHALANMAFLVELLTTDGGNPLNVPRDQHNKDTDRARP